MMDELRSDDPLIQRLRRDATRLGGPSAAWTQALASALDREPPRPMQRGTPAPWVAAAALFLGAALTLGLVDEGSPSPPSPGPVARAATTSDGSWLAVSEGWSLLFGTLFPVSATGVIADPLRAEWNALQRDAEFVAQAVLERASAPLRPWLDVLDGGS